MLRASLVNNWVIFSFSNFCVFPGSKVVYLGTEKMLKNSDTITDTSNLHYST